MAGLTLPGGNAGGGRGFSLGPETNTFGTRATVNRAAAETLRNTYAGANASWLAEYTGNRRFLIHLVWDDGDVLQRRNVAGNDWEDATDVVQGRRGPPPTDAQVDARLRALGALVAANNLSDVLDAATALANLGGVTVREAQTIASLAAENRFTDAMLARLAGIEAGAEKNRTKNELIALLRDTFALLSGAAFTGEVAGQTPTKDEHFATKKYVDDAIANAGPSPVVGHDAFIAWSADTVFTAAEFQAGTTVDNDNSGEIPDQNGFAYLALWIAGDGWDAIRIVDIDHGPNGYDDLEAPIDLTVNGVAGKYRRFTPRLAGDVNSGATLRWR